jgi:pyruvate dehydrogenase E2 component (dihydrolipoyllysine-residue acetyltransferase)
MPTDVKMPKLSDNMEEGVIIRWLKNPGDRVERGEPLAEVETDKADVELEAAAGGILREIRVGEGAAAAVGDVIAILSGADEEIAGAPSASGDGVQREVPEKEAATASRAGPKNDARAPGTDGSAKRGPERSPAPPHAEDAGVRSPVPREPGLPGVRVSPLASRLAEDAGVDLSKVRGSGPGGRVVRRDVEARLDEERHSAADDDGQAQEREASAPGVGGEARTPVGRDGARLEELSRIRRAVARRMAEAKREVPHFYVGAEIDMTEAMRIRERLKKSGRIPNLTVTHLLIRAAALCLRRHPRMNASWSEDGIRYHDEVNIGIAVALEDGLVVPVLHSAESLSLQAIATRASELTERARAEKFSGDDLTGGTFSISNVGMFDVDSLVAVINPPQAGILATAAVKERPLVRDGAIVSAATMTATLSCDHRVLNGIEAARFLADLKGTLEDGLALVMS